MGQRSLLQGWRHIRTQVKIHTVAQLPLLCSSSDTALGLNVGVVIVQGVPEVEGYDFDPVQFLLMATLANRLMLFLLVLLSKL